MTVPTPESTPQPPPAAPAPKKNRWLIPVIAGAAVLFLCCVGGVTVVTLSGGDPDSDPNPAADSARDRDGDDRDVSRPTDSGDRDSEPAEEPAEEPEPAGFGAGIWEVGTEIPAGTYVTVAPDGRFSGCYWARLSGFSGSFDDIVANDNLDGGARGRVTISDDDAGVEFTGDCRWVEESEAEPVDVGDEVGPGVWRVGDEVAPGTYVTTAPDGDLDMCYWARLSGFSGEFDDMIANDLISSGARGRVEINGSDVGIEFSGDCVWTRN